MSTCFHHLCVGGNIVVVDQHMMNMEGVSMGYNSSDFQSQRTGLSKVSKETHIYKLNVSIGHTCLLCLFLGVLHHVDVVLGDAVHLHIVILGHISVQGDHINVMEGHDAMQHNLLCVEGLGVQGR